MPRVLVLDQGYRPHRVVPWERAVTMLFAGKVEVLEAYDEELRSVSIAIKMPAVVRLHRRIRRRPGTVRFSRMNLLARDGFRCQYCGARLDAESLSFDHVLPRSRGGRTCWDNIVTACLPCNERKGDRTPEEAGMRLRQRPRAPECLPFLALRLDGGSVPEAWRAWIYWHGTLEQDP